MKLNKVAKYENDSISLIESQIRLIENIHSEISRCKLKIVDSGETCLASVEGKYQENVIYGEARHEDPVKAYLKAYQIFLVKIRELRTQEAFMEVFSGY